MLHHGESRRSSRLIHPEAGGRGSGEDTAWSLSADVMVSPLDVVGRVDRGASLFRLEVHAGSRGDNTTTEPRQYVTPTALTSYPTQA